MKLDRVVENVESGGQHQEDDKHLQPRRTAVVHVLDLSNFGLCYAMFRVVRRRKPVRC